MANFPCATDLAFYQSKRLPAWAWRLKPQGATVDSLVNAHAGARPTSAEVAASNLLVILSGYRRRGEDLAAALVRIAMNPECSISPKQRAAFARKWALRLGQAL